MSDSGHTSFHRADPGVLDDDPFWSVVRRRHPDLDIVLLPDDPADDDAGPPGLRAQVGPERTAAELQSIADAAVASWRTVGQLLAGPGRGGAVLAWSGRDLTIAEVIRGRGAPGGTELLRSIGFALGADGWVLAPSTREGRPLLRTRRADDRFEGEAGAGATVLRMTLAVPSMGERDRQALRAAVGEEVASWG